MSDYLGKGARLKAGPSPALAATAFAYELRATPFLFEPLGYADMAHVAALMRGSILDEATGRTIMAGLLRLHETPLGELAFDPSVGDIYNNRDRFLKAELGVDAGRIHTGRARREAVTTAWQLACRARLVELGLALTRLCEVMVDVARAHRHTLMPDFTYLQHAHPTSLGHYLLGFVYPLLRDLERVERACARINRCPAGSGSVNGSRFPIDREYIAGLLRFEGLVTHNRDAMWAPDMTTEAMTALLTLATNLDRWAEELFLWATEEFGFVRLNDEHCRTSVIMPQKKNPYGLAHIRGHARNLVGTFTGLVCNALTPTGQPDNRIFAYHDLPESIEDTALNVVLMAEIMAGSTFDVSRMRMAVDSGFPYATDLCDFLVMHTGVDNRSVHRVMGLAVARCADEKREVGVQDVLDAASELGVTLAPFDHDAFLANRDPQTLVELRQTVGGAGDAPMTAMLDELGEALEAQRKRWQSHSHHDFEAMFLDQIRAMAQA